ncbi:MAG: PPM-type phosphatase protein [Anaerolineales bacterium]|nr:PPM-type phosphatase protein [Anaerolineales bacterium]MBM2849529.1 PPM-type phosphatase protein [Anaerolineales bacterium]
MATLLRNFWQSLTGGDDRNAEATAAPVPERPREAAAPAILPLEIAPNDPLAAYFQSSPGTAEVDRINLDSAALRALKAAGVKMVMPLVSQGELIGLLNLGPRLSEQDYSTDDRGLLSNLSAQASPAVRVAQLVRQQQLEAQARERLEQELRVGRLVQQTLLPKELPTLPGWDVAAHYQPARAVGGDFYDFVYLADGRLGIFIGDVSDKGVPAALVMATTRAILRGAAQRTSAPGEVLEQANDLLHLDIPPKMFVTCLYAILDPATGRLVFANAGHDLPYRRGRAGVDELRATGMPLGLMPGMRYEQKEIQLLPGERVLFHSDGIAEAHAPDRKMFGFPRLRDLMASAPETSLVNFLLAELARFTGPGWEQEDDVTLVILERTAAPREGVVAWRAVLDFAIPSEPGNEREAMKRVAEAAETLGMPPARLERLKTAVAEAIMNAIEHGNKNRPEIPVGVRLLASDGALAVRITDQGGGRPILKAQTPDLDAKLAGQQTPRGWGLFLIEKMVDEMRVTSDEATHTIELILHLKGNQNASQNA